MRSLKHRWNGDKRPSSPPTIPSSCPPIAGSQCTKTDNSHHCVILNVGEGKLNQCFGSGFFFPDPDQTFFSEAGSGSAKNPDPDPWKKHPKTRVKVEKILYFISSTLNTFFFGQAPPKLYQKSKPSFSSLKLISVNGRIRIRTFKTRIQIGEKTRIQPDPKHWVKPFVTLALVGIVFLRYRYRTGFVRSVQLKK